MNRHVELWSVALDAAPEEVVRLSAFLSPDEHQRAQRYATDVLARRFIVARGALRELLAAHAGCCPSALTFDYGRSGKPFLEHRPIVFNLSHSDSVAVVAIGTAPELVIGVDVEAVRPMPDLLDIAQRFFTRNESEELASLDEEQRQLAFFHCWTRKEAYLKAMGDGLLLPLDGFEVTLLPGEAAALRHIGGRDAAGWSMHHFTLPGHVAALAMRGCAIVRPIREFYVRPIHPSRNSAP